jgi:hypothetical protein
MSDGEDPSLDLMIELLHPSHVEPAEAGNIREKSSTIFENWPDEYLEDREAAIL